MIVPTVLATTARRSCTPCCASDKPVADDIAIPCSPCVVLSWRTNRLGTVEEAGCYQPWQRANKVSETSVRGIWILLAIHPVDSTAWLGKQLLRLAVRPRATGHRG